MKEQKMQITCDCGVASREILNGNYLRPKQLILWYTVKMSVPLPRYLFLLLFFHKMRCSFVYIFGSDGIAPLFLKA